MINAKKVAPVTMAIVDLGGVNRLSAIGVDCEGVEAGADAERYKPENKLAGF